MANVTVADNTGTISISDGNSTIYIEKKKVDVTAQGGNVTIRWDENTYVTYSAAQFIAPSGTAPVIAAAIAVFLDTGAASGITGSGTTGYIPKWTGASALGNSLLYNASTGIGLGTTTPDASAVLDMTSTTQGLLTPRMTTAQKNLIAPATGLLVFDTDLGLFSYYTGSAWVSMDTGTLDYTQGGNAYAATGRLGLTDNNLLQIITNNLARINITGAGLVGINSAAQAGVQLYQVGSGSTSATYSMKLVNSSATELFNVRDDGVIGAGSAMKNLFIGFNCGTGFTGASDDNVGIGYEALRDLTTGADNVAVGQNALSSITASNFNVAVGNDAALNLTGGSNVIAIGHSAQMANLTGSNCIAIGSLALSGNTATADCIAIGSNALGALGSVATGTGQNIAIGNNSNATGSGSINYRQISIGDYSLNLNTGGENTVVGYSAMGTGTGAANFNCAFGNATLTALTTGGENTAYGYNVATRITTGSRNVFIGAYCGNRQTGGASDILMIDNRDRATAGAELTNSLIYGVFNAAVVNQRLTFNALTTINGRLLQQQGADVASAAGGIALGGDGNVFEITGTAAITLIDSTNWQNGSVVTLVFTSTATVASNTTTSGANTKILLAGNVTFNASADDTLTLCLCEMGGAVAWRELARTAI